MRVLHSATGNVTHMDGRERPWTTPEGEARVTRAEGPLCNSVGASRGNVRWYERNAPEVTCRRCLRILAGQHAEAITENEIRTLKTDARADLAEVLAEVATEVATKPAARRPVTEADMVVGAVVFKGNGKTAYRVYAVRTVSVYGGGTALRAGLVKTTTKDDPSRSTWWAASELTTEQTEAERVAEEDEPSGMYVELSSGLTEYVEPGERLQHKDSGTLATVTAVGPNALDLLTDDGTSRSGASWYWGRPSLAGLPEVAPALVIDPDKYDSDAQLAEATAQVRALREAGPIDRQAVLSTRIDSLMDSGVHTQKCRDNGEAASGSASPLRIYTPNGEAALALGSGTHGGRPGVWAVREGNDPGWGAFFVDEESLTLQFSAYRPGERARLADATRSATPLATPARVADLAAMIARQAELFASGTVPEAQCSTYRERLEGHVQTLASWLGMSTPVKLASYASPYGGSGTVAEVWQARAGVQARLCRVASSRWTTYGATCNAPVREDGTCPEAQLHV